MYRFYLHLVTVMSVTIIITCEASAQKMHEFSVRASGGIAALRPSTSLDRKNGGGIAAAVDYSWFWHNKWGFTIGVEQVQYRSSITGSLMGVNTPNYVITESQESRLVNIPLWFEHRSKALGRKGWRYYGKLGGKLGIPQRAKYWEEGVGNGNSNLQLKTAVSVSTETGFRWCFTDHIVLYTGIYVDWGLNDVRRSAVDAPGANTCLFNDLSVTRSLAAVSAGLMLRLSVAMFKNEKGEQP